MSADPIVPDTKDWTWAAERRCAECGFDASAATAAELPELVRALTEPWVDVLARDDVAIRPERTRWSPLEYGCHVHEVLDVFTGRFVLIAEQDSPTLPNWDQDTAATEGEYAAQEPARIAREIAERAATLVAVLEGFDPPEFGRTAARSDGAAFTALSLGRYLAHDLAHHLHDVGAGQRIPALGSPRG